MNNIELDNNLLELLPPWYREVLEYQQICETEGNVFDGLAAEIEAVAQNFFFQTMDEPSVYLWEQILNIAPNPQTETLAFRQARLINRLSTRPPFTLGFLYQKLDELIGPGEWTVTVDYPNYTLYIESSAQDQSYATEVAFTVNRIKPAHIVYVNKPFIQSGLLLSEEITGSTRQWNYILGAWPLGAQPFATDLDAEVFKVASTPSVQTALLNATATFVSGDVASVRLNGSISITNLTKNVTGSTLTIEYTVTNTQTTEITQVELLDADSNVLTSSAIYVPVQTTQVMTHTIPVAEGVVQSGN